MNTKLTIPFILLFTFTGNLHPEEKPVIKFSINNSYSGVRDRVPSRSDFGEGKVKTIDDFYIDHISWSFTIKPDNSAYLSLYYGSANGISTGCKINDGRLTYNEVIAQLEKVKNAPLSNQKEDVDYQAVILHEGEDGTTGRMYLKNPDLWNYIIDRCEGHLLPFVRWPVEDSPAYMNFFKREFQNIRMPTPDPHITADPPPTAVDPFFKDEQGNYEIAEDPIISDPEKREQRKAIIEKAFREVMEKENADTPEKE